MSPERFHHTGVDARDQIVRLERRIEELTDTAGRCRRIGQIAKVAVVLGGVWIVAAMLGVVRLNAMSLVGSITFLIGGIVAFGSNASTWQQTLDGIEAAEAQRATLIGGLDLAVVADAERDGLQISGGRE